MPPGSNENSWRDEIGVNYHHAAHSAAAYWVWDAKSGIQYLPSDVPENIPDRWNANIYADRALRSENTRRAIDTNCGSKTWYYDMEFARCASNVNLPAAIAQNPPNNMNGLVDRSTAFINSLVVLTDIPIFRSVSGVDLELPENYTRRRE